MFCRTWRRRAGRATTTDRHIFHYHDGRRDRSADPLAVWAALEAACGGSWEDLLRLVAAEPTPGATGEMLRGFYRAQAEARTKLADAVCVAFGVKPYADGEGLTLAERIALAAAYLEFMGGLAELARPFVTPSPPASPCPPGSATPSGAACGSAATA